MCERKPLAKIQFSLTGGNLGISVDLHVIKSSVNVGPRLNLCLFSKTKKKVDFVFVFSRGRQRKKVYKKETERKTERDSVCKSL